jgi:GAF domain-containing protein
MDELAPLRQLVGELDRGEIEREAFLDGFVRHVAALIGCTRAGVWVFQDRAGERISHCIAMYDARPDALVAVTDMVGSEAGAYFDALLADGFVAAADARADPATRVFLDEYLLPLDVRSLLDVCFSVNGRLFGTFSCEQVGTTMDWTVAQLTLLRRIASTVSLALMRAASATVDTAPGALWDPPTPWPGKGQSGG